MGRTFAEAVELGLIHRDELPSILARNPSLVAGEGVVTIVQARAAERRADPMPEREMRYALQQPVEFRQEGDGEDEKNVIEGYAALIDVETELWPGHSEKIARGAFDDILAQKPDTRCLFNHDMNFVLGRTLVSGTLTLAMDDTGLRYTCELPNTANGEMVAEAIRRGDVSQSSFSFRAGKTSWDERDDDEYLRTIERVDELYDVGPVAIPAYADTTVALRSAQEWRSASGRPPLADPAGGGGSTAEPPNPPPAPSNRTAEPPADEPEDVKIARKLADERVMGMYDAKTAENAELRRQIAEKDAEIARKDGVIEAKDAQIEGLLKSLKAGQ